MSYKHQQVALGIGVTDEQTRRFKRLRAASERRTHTNRIARQLGVTASGLEALSIAASREGGIIPGGQQAHKLTKQGYAEAAVIEPGTRYGFHVAVSRFHGEGFRITQAGRDLVARARSLGW